MDKGCKRNFLNKQKELLYRLPSSYERNIMISEKDSQLNNKINNYPKFRYVKHFKHMEIDIYEILWNQLYGHFKRLLDTMNENNVVDLDSISVWRSAKFVIKNKLIWYWVLREVKMDKNINSKLYMNPLFWLYNRVSIKKELLDEFKDINNKFYNIIL